MKNVFLIVLLLISIFFLMPVGLMDICMGGSVAPFRRFVIPAFWTAWKTQTGAPWVRRIPRPFSWLVQVFLTILAVITFWGVLIFQPLFALARYFIHDEILDSTGRSIPENPEVTVSPFGLRCRVAGTKIKKFTLATSRAAAAVPSRLRGAAIPVVQDRGSPVAYEGDIPIYASPENGELQEVIL